MEYEQKALLVNQICAGYSYCGKVKLYALKQDYQLDIIYNRAYERGLKRKLLSDDELLSLLSNNNIWTTEQEVRQEEVLKKIDDLKVDLYKEIIPNRIILIRKELKETKEELNLLYYKRHSYDEFSAKGYADYVKMCSYIQKYSYPSCFSRRIVSFYKQNSIGETVVRELSRTEPWSSTYETRRVNGKIFKKFDLTYDQMRLLRWSILYDKIAESYEPPDERVMKDDDLLDGWMIYQSRERKKEKKKQAQNVLKGKAGQGQEVYIPAHSVEDVREINDLNDGMSKAIKQHRTKLIREKGEIKEQELPDVKKDLMILKNQVSMKR